MAGKQASATLCLAIGAMTKYARRAHSIEPSELIAGSRSRNDCLGFVERTVRESGPSSVRAAMAERYFRDAIALAQQQGALFWELRATLSLARLHVAQNQPNPRQMLASVYERFTEGFDAAELQAARTILETPPSN